ncbi:MAG: hypothetical protein K6A15_00030 [Treponema sp.]|nr:hypothetical protein [Treponema sp.]
MKKHILKATILLLLSMPLAGAATVDSLYEDSISRNLAQMEEFYRRKFDS